MPHGGAPAPMSADTAPDAGTGEPRIRVHDALADIPASAWDALAGEQLFLRHAFLRAFEDTGAVSPGTGWTPCHLGLWQGGALVAAMPLYLKAHSRGEYVFDHAWADAWQRSGMEYYPKLLSAIPFTPVTGRRLLARDAAARAQLAQAVVGFARRLQVSSLHVLFPIEDDRRALADAGLLTREGVQFHWRNGARAAEGHAAATPAPGLRLDAGGERFTSFEDFLATFNHDKRKKIRQERRRVHDAGIRFRRLRGRDIGEADWAFFHRCYSDTYHRHGQRPYLDLSFFLQLADTCPEDLLLVLGSRGEGAQAVPVACALDVHSGERVYGRYWGGTEWHSGLHFETCYYQSIEYCIDAGAEVFEGGAQGEHKLARGLAPTLTRSVHWLAHPRFAEAVGSYLERESRGIAHYVDELAEHAPFRRAAGDAAAREASPDAAGGADR